MSIRAISPYYFIRSSVQPLKRNVCVLPQSHKLHHAYMPISRKNTTSITSYIAILNRTYASTPSAVQLQKHNGEQGVESDAPSNTQINKDQAPAYDLTFTCKKCLSRSTHRVSKQGFYKGTVLITCSGCKNRHLISDHLKIFSDKPVTIEDLMREKGQLVRRGSLNSEGDVEFWDNEPIETKNQR